MENCLFCRIAAGEIESNKVYEDERVLAIHDINPVAPVHILLIPKEHISSLHEVDESHTELMGYVQVIAARLARELGLEGFRVVNNSGATAGQSVFHIHYHLLGGRGFRWPPG